MALTPVPAEGQNLLLLLRIRLSFSQAVLTLEVNLEETHRDFNVHISLVCGTALLLVFGSHSLPYEEEK